MEKTKLFQAPTEPTRSAPCFKERRTGYSHFIWWSEANWKL